MGRDPCHHPAPDLRGDPGAVLYETQKLVAVEVIGSRCTGFMVMGIGL